MAKIIIKNEKEYKAALRKAKAAMNDIDDYETFDDYEDGIDSVKVIIDGYVELAGKDEWDDDLPELYAGAAAALNAIAAGDTEAGHKFYDNAPAFLKW